MRQRAPPAHAANPPKGSPFFRSSGLPFFTEATKRSPMAAAGRRLRRPLIPGEGKKGGGMSEGEGERIKAARSDESKLIRSDGGEQERLEESACAAISSSRVHNSPLTFLHLVVMTFLHKRILLVQ